MGFYARIPVLAVSGNHCAVLHELSHLPVLLFPLPLHSWFNYLDLQYFWIRNWSLFCIHTVHSPLILVILSLQIK